MKLSLSKTRATGWTLLLILVLTAFLTSCSSVDPAPFTQFADSLKPLRDAIDTQAATAASSSRQELIDKITGGEISPADLQLQFASSDPYATSYGFAEDGEPNFVKFGRFQRGLSALNDAMIAYAQSLELLAGGDESGDILPSTAEFDQMAKDLNTNAGTAAAALGVSGNANTQALLSTAAIQLFKAYIEHKRSKELIQALNEVQPQVDEYSSSARQALRLLASLVETDYDKKIIPLLTASPPNANAILAFNDATQTMLDTLKSMSNSYAALPAAHRDLMAAADNKTAGLAGIIALGDEAARLNGLITQLKTANEAAAAAAN